MRLSKPRIPALTPDQWDAPATELLSNMAIHGVDLNVFRTLANHPDLLRRWMVFTNHIMFKSTLAERTRQLLILRIAYLCGSEYQWGIHAKMARKAGVTENDLRAIQVGPAAPELDETDRILLQATDELYNDDFVSEETWGALSTRFDKRQLMDIVFTVGQYNLVSMMLNSFGVQLEPGLQGF